MGNVDQNHLRRALNDKPTICGIRLPEYPRVYPVEGQGYAKPQEKHGTFSGEPILFKDLGGEIAIILKTF